MFKRCKVVMLPTNEKAGDFSKERIYPCILKHSWMFDKEEKGKLIFSDSNIRTPTQLQHLYILSNDEIKEGNWCYVRWGVDIDGKDLFEIAQCTKIGIGGIYYFDEMSMCWGKHELNAMKVIATTDTSLFSIIHSTYPSGNTTGVRTLVELPQPTRLFIVKYVTEYNKGNVITDVLVEYEEIDGNCDCYYTKSCKAPEHLKTGELCRDEKHFRLKIFKDNTITIKEVKDSWSREELVQILSEFGKDVVNKESHLPHMFELYANDWIEENL